MPKPARASLFLSPPDARFGQLDALDGLRGLAVLIVLLSHLSNAGLHLVPGLSLSGIGKSGVYLFFVLSAFLLTRALLEKKLSAFSDIRLWANYALRRVLRIWPLYLVVLLASAALTHAGTAPWWHFRLDQAALIGHLLLAQGQSVLWSIPVEFKYYGLLPVVALVFVLLRHGRAPWWLDVLALIALSGVALWLWPPSASAVNDVRLGPYLSLFFCGAYAAAVQARLSRGTWRLPAAGWNLLVVLALLPLALTVPVVWQAIFGGEPKWDLTHRWFAFFGVVWSALLLATVNGPGWLNRLFASRAMRVLGVVSFSAYLWHMVVLDAMGAAGMHAWPLAAVVFLASTVLVSCLSYLAFERPWRNITLSRTSQ